MTMTFAVDPNTNDLFIFNNKLGIIDGIDEVRQRVMIALHHEYQEYFLNVPAGVPWNELILGSKNMRIVESILRDIVLNVPGVVSIISFAIDTPRLSNNRKLTISMQIEAQGIIGTNIIDIVSTFSG